MNFKRILVLLSILAASLLILSGCGGGAEQNNDDGQKDEGTSLNLTIVGGSVGGVWSVYSEGVAEVIRRGSTGSVVTVEPGTTTGNPGVVSEGAAQLGLAFGMTAYSAYNGSEPFDKAYDNLRVITALIPQNPYQFVITKNSGITSFEQIKEQKYPLKISADSKGSAGDIVTRAVLEAYGINYSDIESWGGKVYYLSGGKTFEMMSDGRMDATGDCVPAPAGDILEASSSIDFNMLPLSDDAIQKVYEKLGMSKAIVQKDAYSFLQTDIPTVNMPVILIATTDMPEDQAYNITKAIYENTDYLKTVAKGFTDLNDQTIIEVNNMPMHPGAEKFFKEKGLIE